MRLPWMRLTATRGEGPSRSSTGEGTNPAREPWWSRLRLSLRTWMLVVGLVGIIVGTQYRRESITPSNVKDLAPVARLDKDDIWRIAWSRDRDRMGVVGWEKPVEVRDAISLKLLETIGEGKKIVQFAFSPKEDVVAYSENAKANTAKILDLGSGKTITLDAGGDQANVTFSPDGSLLATGAYGTAVRLWSVADGGLIGDFDVGPIAGGLTPEFSPDGRMLAVGNRNSSTRLFETATGKLLSVLPKASSHEIQFHPGGHTLAVTYVDGSVALWSVPDGKLIHERASGAKELYTVDWTPDGSVLATAGREGTITLWDPRDLTVIRELTCPEWVVRVKFSPDGMNLHYAGGMNRPVVKRHLGVLGVEGSLYSLLNRPKR